MPVSCPSCQSALQVRQLACQQCATQIQGDYPLPGWLRLGHHEQRFLVDFVLASGSLKALAKQYGVSYPTVRSRLNDVIDQLRNLSEPPAQDDA